MGRNTVAMRMAGTLPYFLITVKLVPWGKSLLVIHKILMLFFKALIVDEKHSLLNRDNLTLAIRRRLYQKEKTISQISFSHF